MTATDVDRIVKILIISLVIAAGHMAWLANGGSPGEIVTGFGAALILVGLTTIGATMFRKGAIDRATSQAMPQDSRTFLMRHDPAYNEARVALWAEVRSGVISERITAAVFIAIGTLLNGYGPAVARLLHLRGA